jgi:ATP-dependent DNA helicase RecQ
MKGSQPPPTSLADLIARRIESADRNSGAGADRAAFRRSSPEDAADIAIDADPEVLRRFERLRGVRAELAKERKLPPYCICHDKTLKAIAHAAPSDSAGLERIKGMGPYKIQQYGQALLVALRPND